MPLEQHVPQLEDLQATAAAVMTQVMIAKLKPAARLDASIAETSRHWCKPSQQLEQLAHV
jgi:hypothetical protein